MMKRSQRGKYRLLQRTEGVSAVELALVLPVLLLIICGIMDFGNLYLQYNIASEAAREGARRLPSLVAQLRLLCKHSFRPNFIVISYQ